MFWHFFLFRINYLINLSHQDQKGIWLRGRALTLDLDEHYLGGFHLEALWDSEATCESDTDGDPWSLSSARPSSCWGVLLLSHQRLSQGKCLLDMELRENLGATAPWSQVCPSFGATVLLEAGHPLLHHAPAHSSSPVLGNSLVFSLPFFSFTSSASLPLTSSKSLCFFQPSPGSLLLPLRILFLLWACPGHLTGTFPEAMACRTFFHLNGLGRRAANVQWEKEKI